MRRELQPLARIANVSSVRSILMYTNTLECCINHHGPFFYLKSGERSGTQPSMVAYRRIFHCSLAPNQLKLFQKYLKEQNQFKGTQRKKPRNVASNLSICSVRCRICACLWSHLGWKQTSSLVRPYQKMPTTKKIKINMERRISFSSLFYSCLSDLSIARMLTIPDQQQSATEITTTGILPTWSVGGNGGRGKAKGQYVDFEYDDDYDRW